MARAQDTFFSGRSTELDLSLQSLQQGRKMSDDELEDFEPDQDDLEKEDDEKETEEWEDYRKEGEEYSEEVRAGNGGVLRLREGVGTKGMPDSTSSCSGCSTPSRRT